MVKESHHQHILIAHKFQGFTHPGPPNNGLQATRFAALRVRLKPTVGRPCQYRITVMLDNSRAKQIDQYIANRLAVLAKKYTVAHEAVVAGVDELVSLLTLLRTNNAGQQCHAALALGSMGDSRAVLPLAQTYYAHNQTERGYFQYGSELVRVTIAAMLFEFGETQELFDILSAESGYVRPEIVVALSQADNRVRRTLIDALTSPHSYKTALPYYAARALGQLREKPAVAPLISVLLDHPDPDTRSAAAAALGEIGDNQALDTLLKVQQCDHDRTWWGHSVSETAATAIQQIQALG